MNMMVRSMVVKIGNSRGIRIPRMLLAQAGLTVEVEMMVEGNRLIIHSVLRPRQGWPTQFTAMAERGDDSLLNGVTPTQWDRDDWIW